MLRRKNKSTTHGRLYKDSETIIEQGIVGDCLYVIQQGKVDVICENGEHKVKIAELGKKEFFGEMALFKKNVRSCTVKANRDAMLLTLDKKGLFKTILNDPSLALRLLERLSNRLREVNKKLVISECH